MKRGKRYQEAAKAIDRTMLYDPEEAIALVKKAAVAKFDETIEVHIRTGCDGRHADQQIRGAVVLPHGTGRSVRVLVFAKDAKLEEAQAAGADFVGGEELIPKIQNDGWLDFDVVVATPDMMGVVGRLGRVLGPKGLMPNPKAGTVTMDVAKAISDIKAGKIEYRLDKTNIVHVPIGKASFSEDQLKENFQTLIETILKARPSAYNGTWCENKPSKVLIHFAHSRTPRHPCGGVRINFADRIHFRMPATRRRLYQKTCLFMETLFLRPPKKGGLSAIVFYIHFVYNGVNIQIHATTIRKEENT